MRLSERLIAQYIDKVPPMVVLKDDHLGTEVVIPLSQRVGDWIREHCKRHEDGHYEVEAIDLAEDEWAVFCFALGYFWCGAHHAPA